MHAARPGTASGGRPQTAKESFTVRIRTDKATIRCILASAQATIHDLRVAIESQSGIPVSAQLLTRERRHWFDDAPAEDDFRDPTATLQQCGVQHGDMLFVGVARPVVPLTEELQAAAGAIEDDNGLTTPAPPPASTLRGWDLADDAAPSVHASAADALSSQTAASELVCSIRTALQARPDADVDAQLAELERLLPLCGTAAATTTVWSSTADASVESGSDATVTSALHSRVNSSSSHQRPSSALEDAGGLVTARPGAGGSTSSRKHSRESSTAAAAAAETQSDVAPHPSDSTPASTAAAAATAAAADAQYWKDRYGRLRVKAEKMNAAGLSLRNQMDVAALSHEKALLLMRGKLERREQRIARLERRVHAWEERDRAAGGEGKLEPYEEETVEGGKHAQREQLTSLTAAPTISSGRHQPAPPVTDSPVVSVVRRNSRPESAGRFRGSRPSSGAAEGPVAADPRHYNSNVTSATQATAAAPLVRPASAGRRRPSSATAAAPVPVPGESGIAADSNVSDEWGRASHLISPLSLPPEAAAVQAQLAAAQLHSSRSQVRQAIDAAKLARSGGAGGMRSAAALEAAGFSSHSKR